MSFLIVIGIFFAGLFLTAYITKRRLGLLGLALAAGFVIASFWTDDLTPIVAKAGIEIVRPPLGSIVATILTLLPALLVFFSGGSVKGTIPRLIHAGSFALLAVAFLSEPLGSALVVDATAQPVYDFLRQYHAVIITAGLSLALLDLVIGSKKPRREKDAKH